MLDIGVGGTELVYFATFSRKLDGGIMVTASHNPPNYNGMKFVREQSRPISADTGLQEIQRARGARRFGPPAPHAARSRKSTSSPSTSSTCLSYVDSKALAPLKIVVNAGNGGAGPIVDLLEPHLAVSTSSKYSTSPTAAFPNGVPNPMIEENRTVTIERVRAEAARI